MRQILNERHAQKEEVASNLDILRELNKREALNEEFIEELKKLEAKHKGVEIVLEHIHKYAKDHWFYMTDLSLDYYGILTCDLLLATAAGIYTFEINYYDGLFEFKDKQSTINGRKLNHNPTKHAQTVSSQLNSLAMMESVDLKVQGAAVFPSFDNKIMIADEVQNIEIVTSDQFKHYLDEIVQADKNYEKQPVIEPQHIRWLAKIDRNFPNWSVKISDDIRANIRPGITCCHCDSFDVNIGDPYISCDCGMHESLEEAIVRTVCEYGVLNNDKQLYPPDLLDFFDYQITIDNLTKYLDKHFTPVA